MELQPRNAADYLGMLQSLLPPGQAWTRALGSILGKALLACAEELARVDIAARLLPEEANPASSIAGLEDWERVFGLPDGCLPAGSSFQERRGAVLARMLDAGLQNLAYWYELAETLGYAATIEEHWPFVCGWHECGDPQAGWTPESGMTAERWEQEMGYPAGRLGAEESRYWWNVIVHGDHLILFRCGESLCPEPLGDWRGADSLECVMRRDKLAHTLLTFEYREE
ncbi:MAG: DUF2313 domain-containing protein [Desulfovibrionaceae bacterium]|nr:DUF2313 domain-containing protein [Desulfovibrionaceae bacterium]